MNLELWREGEKRFEKAPSPLPFPFARKYNNSFFFTRTAPSSPSCTHTTTLRIHSLTQLQECLHFLREPLGGSLISLAFNPLPFPIPSPHMADVRPRQELGEKLSGPGTPYSPPRGCLSERFWRYYRGPSPPRQAQSHGVMNFGDPMPLRARLSREIRTWPPVPSEDFPAI